MKYELTFNEALDVVIKNKGWVQGEQFANGVVIMFDNHRWLGKDYIHVHDFTLSASDCKSPLSIKRGILSQKYRVVNTQPDAERKL